MSLPATPLLLLGPGPSPVSSRVMAALGAPARSHLDPDLTKLLDDIRSRLTRVFRAPEDAVTLAISGTGTSGMEAVAANLVEPGRHALVVVNGYFGDRLAGLMARYGATVDRLEGEWGRAISRRRESPRKLRYCLLTTSLEWSTAKRPRAWSIPWPRSPTLARRADALTVVDAVTSLGAVPV